MFAHVALPPDIRARAYAVDTYRVPDAGDITVYRFRADDGVVLDYLSDPVQLLLSSSSSTPSSDTCPRTAAVLARAQLMQRCAGWHMFRDIPGMITGSMAAAVLGQNKYLSSSSQFRICTGQRKRPTFNYHMSRGVRLESKARALHSRLIGDDIVEVGLLWVPGTVFAGSPDGITRRSGDLCEYKVRYVSLPLSLSLSQHEQERQRRRQRLYNYKRGFVVAGIGSTRGADGRCPTLRAHVPLAHEDGKHPDEREGEADNGGPQQRAPASWCLDSTEWPPGERTTRWRPPTQPISWCPARTRTGSAAETLPPPLT